MNSKATKVQAIAAAELSKTLYGSLTNFIKLTPSEIAKSVGMTKKSLGELSYLFYQKRSYRSSLKSNSSKMNLKMMVVNKMISKLKTGFPYRQPSSNWVNNQNDILVRFGKGNVSSFTVSQSTVWHEKHSWKANSTTHTLVINPLDDFTMIGGLLTIFAKKDKKLSAIPCKWYEQSKGFQLNQVFGFLVGDYHIEAETAQQALEVVARKRKAQANYLAKKKALEEKQETALLNAKLVNKEFGFCMAGIRNFCELNNIDSNKSYTIAEVRAIVVANRSLNCNRFDSYLHKLGIVLNCK